MVLKCYNYQYSSSTKCFIAVIDNKLHVPVASLLAKKNNKLLQKLNSGSQRIVHWNK